MGPRRADDERYRSVPDIVFYEELAKIGEPKLVKMASGIETYDYHKMQYFGAFLPKVLYENKVIGVRIVIVKADRNFGLLGRDIIKKVKESVQRCSGTTETKKLPAVEGVCASIKLKQDAKPMFCAARKDPLPPQRKMDRIVNELLFSAILVPVEAGGVANCFPAVWV